MIVDVRTGAEVGRSRFLDAIASRQVTFAALRVVERRVRRYGEVAVVVGRTGAGDWQLVSAQGTPIVEEGA